MNGARWNRRTLARVGRVLCVIVAAFVMLAGLDLFHMGAEKENILRGVGLDARARHADGIALMVAGAFFVIFATLGVIVILLSQIARRQQALEASISASRDEQPDDL